MSIDKLKQEKNVVTRWIHFPLHPETPPEGIPMKDLFRNRDPEQMKATGDYLRQQMAAHGLPYNRRTKLCNSRLAQELGAWADTQPGGEAFHDAMFRAYFVDDRDIGETTVLLDIAASVGLDRAEASRVLEERLFSPKVSEDWEKAWSNGITGVPTFFSRDLFVMGFQPYEVLERFYNHLVKLRDEEAQG